MKKFTVACLVSSACIALAGLWPAAPAMERELAAQGPLMKAHIIDMGQANATLLEFSCGAVLIDAGAQDDEKVDELVRFLNDLSPLSESGSVKSIS